MAKKVHYTSISMTQEALELSDEMCAAYGLNRSALWEMLIRRVSVDDDVVRRYRERRMRPRST